MRFFGSIMTPGCRRRWFGSQRYGFGQHVGPDRALQRVSGNDVDGNAEEIAKLPGNASEGHKPDTVIHVDQEVDVTPLVVVAPSNTAADTDITNPPPLGKIDHRTPISTQPAAKRRIRQPEASTRQGLYVESQLMARRFDQLRQHRHPRLPAVRLIGTDHRLGDTRPPSSEP